MKELLKVACFGDVRDSVEVTQKYQNDANCIVRDNEAAVGDWCILFVSSHGMYANNTKEAFESTIIRDDRYDWTNLAKVEPLKTSVSRFIFIRDLYKQWYISGINSEIDDIDKLAEYLRSLTKGYRLIIVGNSAGGYMAALLAAKLKAERAFSISGQWDISDRVNDAYVKAAINAGYEYLSILKYLDPEIPIFYLYPKGSQWDQKQADLVKAFPNVIEIPFKSTFHGAACYGINTVWLLTKDERALAELSRTAPAEGWEKRAFLFRSVGLARGSILLAKYVAQKAMKKLKKRNGD